MSPSPSPSPSRPHQQICHRLVNLLEAAVPDGVEVTAGWSWKPRRDEFIPDVLVHPTTEETVRFTGLPLLAVEVLVSNCAADLVVKTSEYAAVGLPHYWVVDPRDRVLDTFVLGEDATYRHTAHLTADTDATEVSFGIASVVVDLGTLVAL